jgi:hypothetical protein
MRLSLPQKADQSLSNSEQNMIIKDNSHKNVLKRKEFLAVK